jgi:hypothetical protein
MQAGMIIIDATTVTFSENKIDKVVTGTNAATYKARGWGAGLAMWSTRTWSFTAIHNEIINNAGGILIATALHHATSPITCKIPTGKTSYTNFAGNDWYGIAIVDIDMDSGSGKEL